MYVSVGSEWHLFFFFQAEDGIRDLVRSRGLGDVYKRQPIARPRRIGPISPQRIEVTTRAMSGQPPGEPVVGKRDRSHPVSYTHLTLPTSDLV